MSGESGGPLLHILRIVNGTSGVLQTWQGLLRSSGPGARIRLTFSGISTLSEFASTVGSLPTSLVEGPDHLDSRTRLDFLLKGIALLRNTGYFGLDLFPGCNQERRNLAWRRSLLKQGLWKRLTATGPHSRSFTFAAAAVALMRGIAYYRNENNRRVSVLLGLVLFLNPDVLGHMFPTLPIVGMARTPRISPRWQSALKVLEVLIAACGAFDSLQSTFVTQEEYEDFRQTWRRRTEGTS
ncbi:MAG TPA: hypothetical protein VF221_19180 [Chloroflexota bacterium]